jgi:hypothetical protein
VRTNGSSLENCLGESLCGFEPHIFRSKALALCRGIFVRRRMAKSKQELEKQLAAFKKSLSEHEAKLKKAKADKNKRDMVNYAMSVAGLKNSINEVGTQLRKM